MKKEEFENLKVGEYFHDANFGDEWQVKEILPYDFIEAVCTRSGKSWKEGERNRWHKSASFTAGRHPDNLPKEAQELFVNVYKDNSGALYLGNIIEKSELDAYNGNGLGYLYTAKLIPVEIQQPYTPKHGEKCNVITDNLNVSYECTAAEIKGKIFAFVEFDKDGEVRIFHPHEIKKFIPS